MKQAGRSAGATGWLVKPFDPAKLLEVIKQGDPLIGISPARQISRRPTMGETSNENTHLSAGIDLTQFYQVFFEEAGENLESMEQMLLNLDIEKADEEELNAIFRCAHSVKGGAATFGFADVAELTHQMETLLDKLRRRMN
jgi:hypothetical protein